MDVPETRFPKGYQRILDSGDVASADDIENAHRWVKRLLHAWVRDLPEGARVLDVGCGSGKTARVIRALRPDIFLSGVDVIDMRESLPEGMAFVQGSVEELGALFAPASFDAVLCQHVIEHLLYPSDLVRGIRDVLVPGGSFYMETPNWTRIFLPFSNLWFWNDYTHVRPFSRGSMYRLLNEFNLRIERLETHSSTRWFPRRARSKKIVRTEVQAPDFRNGLTSRLASRLINPIARDILIVVARKPD